MDSSASRTATSASSSSAACTSACSISIPLAPRGQRAPRARWSAPNAGSRPARSTHRGLLRSTSCGARSRRSSQPRRRKRFWRCGSSIRRWAAAPFWSPHAGTWRRRTKRRWCAKAGCRPRTSPSASVRTSGGPIAQRCLYGVDINPMAVQLGRLSLWLATLSADRPLTFLDHRLRAGNSLVGASPADIARQTPGTTPRTTDRASALRRRLSRRGASSRRSP